MSAPNDPSFASQALAWTAAAIAAIGAWLWVHTMGRISKLEENTVDLKTFNAYVERAEKDRDERREAELSLFDELKDHRSHFDARLDRLTDLIRSNKS
jgi:hypothetical protein